MGAEFCRLSIFRAHMVSKRLLILWHRESFIVIINCWTDFPAQTEQFKTRASIMRLNKIQSTSVVAFTVAKTIIRCLADWSRVEFPYVLLLSCQFEGYHPFHGTGTFWDMLRKFYSHNAFHKWKKLSVTDVSQLKLRYCVHVQSNVRDSKLPA